MSDEPDQDVQDQDVQGHYSGAISRLVAATIDWFGAVAVFGILGAITTFFLGFITSREITSDVTGWIGLILFVIWLFLWYWIGQATTGRTPGKSVIGLRAVTRDGEPLGPRRAFVRVLVLPISWLIAGLGFIGIVIGKEHRALHDVAAGSTVIYDWGPRQAQTPKMRLVTRHQKSTAASSSP